MHPRTIRRPLALLLLFSIAVLAVTRAGAQPQLASIDELEKSYSKYSNLIFKLENGQQPATKADHDTMDVLAKWFVYRFVSSPPPDAEKMAKYRKDYESHITRILLPDSLKANKQFINLFGPILKQRYKDLFDQDFYEYRYPIANAAPTLVLAAKLHDDAMYGYLSELLLDHTAVKGDSTPNKHDTIKLYAIRGLREYLWPLDMQTNPKLLPGFPIGVAAVEDNAVLTNAQEKRKARELQCVTALLSYIDKPARKGLPEDELEGIRFVRREAIETLGFARAAAVVYGKKKVEGPIAPALLRVLSPQSDLSPAPSLAERLEAAIGVCQIKWATVPDYQPDLGVYLVGKTVHAFLTDYKADLVDIKNGKPARLHWRTGAKRLENAILEMAANTKNLGGDAAARKLEGNVNFLKDAIRTLKTVQSKDYPAVPEVELNVIRDRVAKMRPESGQVFKNIKEYTIKLDAE